MPITHTDPYPANPTGDWDALLVVLSGDGDQPEVTDLQVSGTVRWSADAAFLGRIR